MDLHSIVGYPGGTRKVRGQSWFLGLEREGGKKNVVVGSNDRIAQLADNLCEALYRRLRMKKDIKLGIGLALANKMVIGWMVDF